jgi:hypothetical protein
MTEPSHDPLPYVEKTDPDYAVQAAATFTVTVTEEDDGTVLSGPCPRCQGTIEIRLYDELVRDWFPQRRHGVPAPPASVGEPMICTCELEHPQRPPGNVGCGAYWNLVLVTETEPDATQA